MEVFTVVTASLLVLSVIQSLGASAGGPVNAVGVDCTLDDDQTNPALDRCLGLGQQFAEKFEKFLKKNKNMDICVDSREFADCLRPMLETCRSINATIDKKWKTILYQIDCVCSKHKGQCGVDLKCLEEEHDSVYTSLCQALYDFNVQQGTHGKCRFLRERVDCEQSLVASSCGEPTGDFYLAMVKARSKKEKCFVPHSYPKLQHFSYSDSCPKNLTFMFSECVDLHPSNTILNFMRENDLVAQGRRKALKTSCKFFDNYNKCVKRLAAQCPLGIEKLLQSNGQIRSYQLKMEYICSEVRQDYLESMYCYQDVMKNGGFDKCTGAWDDVFTKLGNVTSYQFYCQPQLPCTHALSRELDKLRNCYQGIVDTSCGHTAAVTMGNLIHLAFQDPHYLRFEHKADCTLHNADPPPAPRPSPDTTTTTPATVRLLTSSQQHRRSHGNGPETDTRHQRPTPVEVKASVTGGSGSVHSELLLVNWICVLTWVLTWTICVWGEGGRVMIAL